MANVQILDANGAMQAMKTSLVSAENIPWHIISDGTLAATITTRGAVNTLSVQIVDASGAQVTGFGGIEYADGATVATPTGKTALAVYSGHVYALQLDAAHGNLLVSVANSPSVSGTVTANQGTASGGSKWSVQVDNSSPIAVSGSVTVSGTVTADIKGNTGVALDAVLGATKPANVLQVGGNDGTNAYALPLTSGGAAVLVSGGGGGGTQYADGATAATPTGTVAMAANGGKVYALQADGADGNLLVALGAPIPAGTNVIGHVIVDSGAISVTQTTSPWVCSIPTDVEVVQDTAADFLATVYQGTSPWVVSGTVAVTNAALAATGATAPSDAAEQGLIAANVLPTAVTNGQLVGGMGDLYGRQVVLPQAPRDLIGTASGQTTTNSYVDLIAAITSVFADICTLVLTNESSTATIVSITDGTMTYVFALAANGGGVFPFSPPLPATTAHVAWQIKNSAAVTVDAVVTYVKNK